MKKFTIADWAIIQQKFDELIDVNPEKQKETLDNSNLTPRLKYEISALLNAHNGTGILDSEFIIPLDESLESHMDNFVPLENGQQIGPFKIVSLIGRGGMGEVYLGERIEGGFEQRAAIKLLRAELPGQMALFNAERRIVAGLEHPGVSRVIDGGIAPDGRPYMALEYVEGMPLNEWCDKNKIPLKGRLELFLEVCNAVSYAHGHLVIHRDIKPSNILVDKDGRPRLLDFGVAQLVDETFGNEPLPITPDYAAPEQLRGEKSSTSMDIYSLGALLYEMLSGRGPWQGQDTKIPSLIRRMLDSKPALISEAALENKANLINANDLKGDIDAIITKSLHPDAEKRYSSVEAFAKDIKNYLSLHPISALPRDFSYVSKLFVRRHTWAVAASVAFVIALSGGVVATLWQARQAILQRDIARAEVKKTQAVNQALSLMFRSAGESSSGGDTSVKEMVDKSAKDIVESFNTNDKQAKEVVLALGELYTNIEDQMGQAALLSAALEKGIGKDDPEATAHMKLSLAEAYIVLQKMDDAKPLLKDAAAFYGANPEKYQKLYLEERGAEASIARLEGRNDEGIAILQKDMPAVKIAYADDPRELLARYNNLIVHLIEANQLDEAGKWLDEAEAQVKTLHQENTQVANGIAQMRGGWYMRKGDKEAALKTFTSVMNVRRELYGPSSGLAMDMLQVGRMLVGLNRDKEAIPILEEGRAMAYKFMGNKNVPSLVLNVNLSFSYAKLGDVKKAEDALEQARPIANSLPPGAPPWALFKEAEAAVFIAKKQPDEAIKSLDISENAFKKLGALGAPYLENIVQLRAAANKLKG